MEKSRSKGDPSMASERDQTGHTGMVDSAPFSPPRTFSLCPNFRTPRKEEGTKVSGPFFVFNYFPF